jgi:hypothetical protein
MPEMLFQFLSYAPGPFWLLILLWPLNRWAMLAFDAFLILLAAVFAWQAIPALPALLPLLAQPEFEPIYEVLTTRSGFLASWNHMILGDLWIGRWVAQDARHSPRPWLTRLVFLPPILMVGPLGLCAYLMFRTITRNTITLSEPSLLTADHSLNTN